MEQNLESCTQNSSLTKQRTSPCCPWKAQMSFCPNTTVASSCRHTRIFLTDLGRQLASIIAIVFSFALSVILEAVKRWTSIYNQLTFRRETEFAVSVGIRIHKKLENGRFSFNGFIVSAFTRNEIPSLNYRTKFGIIN